MTARMPRPGSSTAPATRRRAARFARQRRGERMAARQGQAGGALEQRRREIGSVGDAKLGQGERAGLVEDDGVGLGEPLDRIAGVEEDAAAEEGAGGDDLHGRDGEGERTGTGDDEDGGRDQHRLVQAGAGDHPAGRGERRSEVHHRRIEPGRPVGEHDAARARLGRLVEELLHLVDQRMPPAAAETARVSAASRLSVPA